MNEINLWNYLQILGQKKLGWPFKKDNVQERLHALIKILEFGNPNSIQNLIPFLKDNNKEIQHATCSVITQLFEKIETKKGFYNTLKHCEISKSDIDFYGQAFSDDESITLYCIATLNSNGYIREKAIKKLAETCSERAIPFIVFRLADWAHAVRETALKSIENFKETAFINALLDNLTVFDWLQKVERTDLSSVYDDIMNFVVVENKNYVIENFETFAERTRIIIAKQLTKSAEIKLEDLKVLLSDKHFLIRNFALSHCEKLTQTEIDKLLVDKSARIRLQTLYGLKNKANFSELIFLFLSDKSASIREFARYSLKDRISDFATLYNDNLLSRKDIIGSLSGLAETNGTNYLETPLPFLNDPKIRVRKTAFSALKKLNNNEAYHFALKNLNSEYIGIRNLVIAYFSNTTTTEVLVKAREIYANGQYDLRRSMLTLFGKVGGWATIGDIMIGTIDENENIRQLSRVYLQRWRNKATSYFIKPQPGELERANQLFHLAFEIHEEKQYFNENPLTGIDFYLR